VPIVFQRLKKQEVDKLIYFITFWQLGNDILRGVYPALFCGAQDDDGLKSICISSNISPFIKGEKRLQPRGVIEFV
jgi:hypothetical protein